MRRLFTKIVFILVLLVLPSAAFAQSLQDQINALDAQIARNQGTLNGISNQADTLQNKLDAIEAELAGIAARIRKAELEIDQTNAQIEELKAKLEKQKRIMHENARVLYKEGDRSTLETLFSSDNFSEFVSEQEYLEKVKEDVNRAAREVIALKGQLEEKIERLRVTITEATLQASLQDVKRAEQQKLVDQTRGEEAAYQQMVAGDQARVAELRRQQAAINLSTQRNVSSGGCGGYPNIWCLPPMDSVVDDWGMYNRECVSYAAWKVASTGRHMPYWGGYGNANQWDENAQASGIPTGSEPRVGSVAISNAGSFGHAMYVEAVYGNGSIRVSQFNVGWDGTYSQADVNGSGLVYIYF